MPETKSFTDKKITTGVPGLDPIFFGGIMAGNTIVVEGTPGTGKTSFGFQFLLEGISKGENGLFVTFEHSPPKLRRDAWTFGWDLEKLEKEKRLKIIQTDPDVLVRDLQNADSVLVNEIKTVNAKRIVLDGLSSLRHSIENKNNGVPFRTNLLQLFDSQHHHDLAFLATNEAIHTPVLGDSSFPHEQFLCDTVLTLRQEADPRGFTHRTIEVAKSRGQGFISGRHTVRIESERGMVVYQRAQAPEGLSEDQPVSTEIVSMGCPGLDKMLGGGIYRGSVTLQVGISGTGKTVLALQAVKQAVARGDVCLVVTLDEHPQQIRRNAGRVGVNLKEMEDQGSLTLLYESPMEIQFDVHFRRIASLVKEKGVKFVVVDSISAYESDKGRLPQDFIYALVTFLKNHTVTTLLNFENPELIGVSQISESFKVSPAVDNIVLLNYVETGNRMRRAITVPKARGMVPSRLTQEYFIKNDGVHIVEDEGDARAVTQLPFSAYYGVLGRAPNRKSPQHEQED